MDLPMSDNLLYALYFVLFSVLGYFLTGPLLINVFMEEYGKHHSKSLEIKKCVWLAMAPLIFAVFVFASIA